MSIEHSADRRADGATRWLGACVRWGLASVLGLGAVSFIAAALGVFTPWLVIPAAAAIAAVTVRFLPSTLEHRIPVGVVVGLVVLVAAVVGIGLLFPHEHVFATRDSGTYVATATWIANTGHLNMDVGSRLFSDVSVFYDTLGFPSSGEAGDLQAQFLHLFPSMLALFVSIGGDSALHWLNPLLAGLGLLTIFMFTTSISSRPWIGLSAALLLATTMPFLYYTRAPFSEPMALVFVFGGLWSLSEAISDRSLNLATGAGLLLGATSLVRIDGIVVLLGLVMYRMILAFASPESRDEPRSVSIAQVMDRVIAISTVMFGIAIAELAFFSVQYLMDHGKHIGGVVATILVFRLITSQATRLKGLVSRHRNRIAGAIAGIVGLWLLYAWTLRPYIESPTRAAIYGIEGLQEAAGVSVEPLRSYAELSVRWLSWYLGIPLVLVGLAGLVVLTHRLFKGRSRLEAPLICVALVVTVPYLYRPSINPDQIWAMRRYLPVVIPALVIIALLVAGEWLLKAPRSRAILMGVVVLVFAVPSLLTTARGGIRPEFEGAVTDMAQACERLGPDPVILFTGTRGAALSHSIGPPLRGSCNATVAIESAEDPLTLDKLDAVDDRAADLGSTLWVIGSEPDGMASEVSVFKASYPFLELTLFGPPSSWGSLTVDVTAWSPS